MMGPQFLSILALLLLLGLQVFAAALPNAVAINFALKNSRAPVAFNLASPASTRSQVASWASADQDHHSTTKRSSFFNPDIQSSDEEERKLTALREAGFMPSPPSGLDRDSPKAIADAGIDSHADARTFSPSELPGRMRPDLNHQHVVPCLPSLTFLALSAAVVCVITVLRGVRGRR
ncbi:hypothetical protein N7474_002101 [Penicillium riverlandense]|uniref:uncharacterized protein n=1 Tax=Penicillium riverlandense TaxID=1903569 RepID=UPI0025470A43|nr:uncharacterized protein N7474_002101 [Penicillium riverlandense]KAJ5833790.1 hypothetical protein N7474_002101 [Penicillium riverlandense]